MLFLTRTRKGWDRPVTIAHGPVESLKLAATTMNFRVKDKALLDRLSSGKKIEFEFVQQGGTMSSPRRSREECLGLLIDASQPSPRESCTVET